MENLFDKYNRLIGNISIDSSDAIHEARSLLITVVTISLIICVIGLIGNFLVLFVITVLKEYSRSVTHWYILQLAIADSLFLLTIPFKVSHDLNSGWIYPEWMCKAKETIMFLNYYASILFLMVMSIDRYIAVCKPFSTKWQELRKQKNAALIAVVVWIIAFVLTTPVMLYSFKSGKEPFCVCNFHFPSENSISLEEKCQKKFSVSSEDYKNCLRVEHQYCERSGENPKLEETEFKIEDINSNIDYSAYNPYGSGYSIDYNNLPANIENLYNTDEAAGKSDSPSSGIQPYCSFPGQSELFQAFLYFNFTVMFLLPMLLMMICYGFIVNRFFVTGKRCNSSTPSSINSNTQRQTQKRKSTSRTNNDRKRVTWMCVALVSSFVVCWLPFHAINIAKLYGIRGTKGRVCEILSKLGILLVFLNSCLNPYLYSFLGTNFSHRWSVATSSVRKSVSERNISFGSVAGTTKSKSRKMSKQFTKTNSAKSLNVLAETEMK